MDYCVCCGNYIPEGDMVCPACKQKLTSGHGEIEAPKAQKAPAQK